MAKKQSAFKAKIRKIPAAEEQQLRMQQLAALRKFLHDGKRSDLKEEQRDVEDWRRSKVLRINALHSFPADPEDLAEAVDRELALELRLWKAAGSSMGGGMIPETTVALMQSTKTLPKLMALPLVLAQERLLTLDMKMEALLQERVEMVVDLNMQIATDGYQRIHTHVMSCLREKLKNAARAAEVEAVKCEQQRLLDEELEAAGEQTRKEEMAKAKKAEGEAKEREHQSTQAAEAKERVARKAAEAKALEQAAEVEAKVCKITATAAAETPAEVPAPASEDKLAKFIAEFQLEEFEATLRDFGVAKPSDLADVTDMEFGKIGIKPLKVRKLRRAVYALVGGDEVELAPFLTDLRLGNFEAELREFGVVTPDDLADVKDAELSEMGVKPLKVRQLRQALKARGSTRGEEGDDGDDAGHSGVGQCVANSHINNNPQKEGERVACDGCASSTKRLWCCPCHTVLYCGQSCQDNDWPRHKVACKAARHKVAFQAAINRRFV